MRTTVSLQAVTDRVLGVVPPAGRLRTSRPNRGERMLAVAMLGISVSATLTSLGLWIGGHGAAGLRLFCGAVLLLFIMLRLR